jgi:hypothetical protein
MLLKVGRRPLVWWYRDLHLSEKPMDSISNDRHCRRPHLDITTLPMYLQPRSRDVIEAAAVIPAALEGTQRLTAPIQLATSPLLR